MDDLVTPLWEGGITFWGVLPHHQWGSLVQLKSILGNNPQTSFKCCVRPTGVTGETALWYYHDPVLVPSGLIRLRGTTIGSSSFSLSNSFAKNDGSSKV